MFWMLARLLIAPLESYILLLHPVCQVSDPCCLSAAHLGGIHFPGFLGLFFPRLLLCFAHQEFCVFLLLFTVLMSPNIESLQFSFSREQNIQSLCVCVCEVALAGFWMWVFWMWHKRASSLLKRDLQRKPCFLPLPFHLLHFHCYLALSGLICSGDLNTAPPPSTLVCGFLCVAGSVNHSVTCIPCWTILLQSLLHFSPILFFFSSGFMFLFFFLIPLLAFSWRFMSKRKYMYIFNLPLLIES